MAIGKKEVKFVNVQAQVGRNKDRHTYSHVNVVADKKVGAEIIKQALNESLNHSATRWVVETASQSFQVQDKRPA